MKNSTEIFGGVLGLGYVIFILAIQIIPIVLIIVAVKKRKKRIQQEHILFVQNIQQKANQRQQEATQTQQRIEYLYQKIENEKKQLQSKINSLTDDSQINEHQRKMTILSFTQQYISNYKVLQIVEDISILAKYALDHDGNRDIRIKTIHIRETLAFAKYSGYNNISLDEISWHYIKDRYAFRETKYIDFIGENLKKIDNELQLHGFMDAISITADFILQQTYVATHPKDISGTPYTAKIKSIAYGSGDRKHYDVILEYEAPNGYYQAPKEWL